IFPVPLWWPSAPTRRLRGAIAELDRVVFDIIEARRRAGADDGDLLALLMQARDEDSGESMTDRQLRDRGNDVPAGRPRDDGDGAQPHRQPSRRPQLHA